MSSLQTREQNVATSPRRRSRFVRRGVLLLFLLALAVVWWFHESLEAYARTRFVAAVERETGARLDVDSASIAWSDLTVRFTGVRLHSPRFDVEVPEGRLAWGWTGAASALFGNVRLRSLVLESPRIEFRAPPEPAEKKSGLRPIDLRAEALEIREGVLVWMGAPSRLSASARDLRLDASWNGARQAVCGSMGFEAQLSVGEGLGLADSTVDSDFCLRASDVELRDLEVESATTRVRLRGRIDWVDAPQLALRGEGRLDLGELPVLGGKGAGKVEMELVLDGPLSDVTLLADWRSGRISYGPYRLRSARGAATYGKRTLDLSSVEARGYEGEIRGGVTLAWPAEEAARFRGELTAREADARSLLATWGAALPLAARVDADWSMSGRIDSPESWSGTGRFSASAADDRPGWPARAIGSVELESGRVRLHVPEARVAESTLTAEIVRELAGTTGGAVEVRGTTEDAAVTRLATLDLLEAIDVELGPPATHEITGRGEFGFRLEPGAAPEMEILLDLRGGRLAGRPFRHANLEAARTASSWRIARLELVDRDHRLRMGAEIESDPWRLHTMDLSASRIELSWLAGLVGVDAVPSGALTGNVLVRQEEDGPRGSGSLRIDGGSWFGESIERVEADIRITPEAVELPRIELSMESFSGRGAGAWDVGAFAGELRIERGEISMAGLARRFTTMDGISGRSILEGDLALSSRGLSGQLGFEGEAWSLGGAQLGPSRGNLTLFPEKLELAAASSDGRGWDVRGEIPLDPAEELTVHIGLADWEWSLGAEGSLRLSGQFDVDRSATGYRLGGELGPRELSWRGETFRSSEPVPVLWDGRRLRAFRTSWIGPDTDVALSFGADTDAATVDLEAQGEIGLGLVSVVAPRLRGGGRATVELRASGAIAQPTVEGAVRILDGRLGWLGFPPTLDRVHADVHLKQGVARLERFEARLGNGAVEGEGVATLRGFELERYEASAELANVRLDYPEGFRGVFEGRLELAGDPGQGPKLSGEIDVLRGVYDREFRVDSLLGSGASRELEAKGETAVVDDVALDLQINADSNVWVRNDLARVEAQLKLDVAGVLGAPEVTGRVTLLDGGKITFRDVEYRVLSGSLDLVERDEIDPYLTLRAETTVDDYTIVLRVEGTLDEFDYELTSDPQLPTGDIIALLTTGRTLEDGGVDALEGGFETTAASYFAGELAAPFERQLERLLGFERVDIDPLRVEGQADPTPRITVGKQVADALFVLFSSDLSNTERQLYQLEWQTTPRFRMTAVRDTRGGYEAGTVYTRRFWWNDPEEDEPRALQPAETEAGETVRSVEVVSPEEELSRQLERALYGALLGKPFTRSTVYHGVELARSALVERGLLEADVLVATSRSDDDWNLEYRVAPGPRIDVSIQGVDGRSERRRLERELRDYWAERIFYEDLYRDSRSWILRWYHERGYYATDVQVAVTAAESGDRRSVEFQVDRGPLVRVGRIEIDDAGLVDRERVERQLLTGRPGVLGRKRFVPSVLEEDVAALRSLYRELGFLDVEIDPPDVRLSLDGKVADFHIAVREGPPFTIGSVECEEAPGFSSEALCAMSGLEPGARFLPEELSRAKRAIRDQLDSQGFAEVRVRATPRREGNQVHLSFRVTPGRKMTVAGIEIVGNRLTRDKIIRRELDLHTGDPLTRQRMLLTQHRLYQLGLFRQVSVAHVPSPGNDPEMRDIRITVEESAPSAGTIGLGWDTEAKSRVSFSLAHDNVQGYDRELGFQGRFSSLEKRLQLIAADPRLFTRRLPTTANLFWEEREEVGFTVERRTAALRVEKRFNPLWSGFLRYSFQNVELFDVEDPDSVTEEKLETVTLGDLGLAFVRDSRDDPLSPARGNYLRIGVQFFSQALLSERDFFKLDFATSRVIPLGRRFSFATSARLGMALPLRSDEAIPISEGYFAGGSSTLRGFQRDEVGPTTGGEAMLLFNEELRFPIWGALRGSLFYDLGNVFPEADELTLGDLREVVGAGLHLQTPIGPLRLEYGRKLDRRPGETQGELLVGIGSIF